MQKRDEIDGVKVKSEELFKEMRTITRCRNACREKMKGLSGKEEAIARRCRGLSTKGVDNLPIKCVEVNLYAQNY